MPAEIKKWEYLCIHDVEKKCECETEDKKHCTGNPACCFCKKEYRNEYVRKPRWYEKYYK